MSNGGPRGDSPCGPPLCLSRNLKNKENPQHLWNFSVCWDRMESPFRKLPTMEGRMMKKLFSLTLAMVTALG